MKKITLLMGLMLCVVFGTQAQTLDATSSRTVQNNVSSSVDVQEIVERYNDLSQQDNNMPVTAYFSKAELQALKSHFAQQNSMNRDNAAVLLMEDFADISTLAGAGYGFVNVSDAVGTTDWFQGNDGVFPSHMGDPTAYIGANFNNTGGSVINNFMITPPLDLENGDEIIFWTRTTTGSTFPDRLEVRIDPDGSNVDPANDTDVGSYTELLLEINPALTPDTYPQDWTQFTATVTGLTGTVNTRVAFRYWVTDAGPVGTNSDFIGIDSLVIQEGAAPPGGMSTAFGFEAFAILAYGSLDPAAPEVFTTISAGANDGLFELAGDVDSSDPTTAYVYTVGPPSNFYSLDIATGVYTQIGPGLPGLLIGMAFDPTSGTLYGHDGNNDLVTVDTATGALTVVGPTGASAPADMAIDASGNAYMHDVGTDEILSVDLTTGATTAIGATGFDANFAQGMTYDPNTDTVYLAAFNPVSFLAEWRSVDVTTGATTLVGVINDPTASEVTWVAIPSLAPPADNDVCEEAFNIECDEVMTGDTSTATDTGGFNTSADRWYSFTGDGTPQFVTVSLCGSDYDTRLAIYDACGGALVAENDDNFAACGPGFNSQLTFLSDGVTEYKIAVEGFNDASVGVYQIAVTCIDVAENDNCDGALPIACDTTVSGSTINALDENGAAPDCDDTVTAPGVWYVYEDTTGLISDITLSTCDQADFDTKIHVYTGDCGALTCVASNDDGEDCTGFTSLVDFQSDGATTFYVLVSGFGTAQGNFDLTMTCELVPPPNDMIVNSIDVDEIGFPYTDPSVQMLAATTEDGGTPVDCDNAGVRGVWYNFVPEMGGTATASVTTPAGFTSVTFYTADTETAVETDLTLVDWFENQCLPSESASIPVQAGQAYYVYVANTDGVTDIVIDGDFFLGADDNTIEGFSYYPNPTSDMVNLVSADTIDTVVVYNILGQEMMSLDINATASSLDVAHLAQGVYLMKVSVNGQVGTYKIVKR